MTCPQSPARETRALPIQPSQRSSHTHLPLTPHLLPGRPYLPSQSQAGSPPALPPTSCSLYHLTLEPHNSSPQRPTHQPTNPLGSPPALPPTSCSLYHLTLPLTHISRTTLPLKDPPTNPLTHLTHLNQLKDADNLTVHDVKCKND